MIEIFDGRIGQFIFVSTAAVYRKPVSTLPITESMPVGNPYWAYANDKILAEAAFTGAFQRGAFPVTIVRPSHTYDSSVIPLLGGWTTIDRMRRGKPALVHGDGTTAWTLSRSEDVAVGIVGLFGHPASLGETFHVTSSASYSWDDIFAAFADAAGVRANLVHVPPETIAAAVPDWAGQLLGDLRFDATFDNAKIAALVPEFTTRITLERGARLAVEWHDERRERREVDPMLDSVLDRLTARMT